MTVANVEKILDISSLDVVTVVISESVVKFTNVDVTFAIVDVDGNSVDVIVAKVVEIVVGRYVVVDVVIIEEWLLSATYGYVGHCIGIGSPNMLSKT